MKVAFLYLKDMKLAFLHARQDPKYAVLMVESVKRHMPQAEIVQLTDFDTASPRSSLTLKVRGVDPTVFAKNETPDVSFCARKALICSAVPRNTKAALPHPVAVTPCKSVSAVLMNVPNAEVGTSVIDRMPPSASETAKPLTGTACPTVVCSDGRLSS